MPKRWTWKKRSKEELSGGGGGATGSSSTNKKSQTSTSFLPAPSSASRYSGEEYITGVREKPIQTLLSALAATHPERSRIPVGNCVVHWFRGDLRVADNSALSLASQAIQEAGGRVGLVGLYVLSPQDLEAHVVSPAKLDFALRSLKILKEDLESKFGVPLWIEVVEKRKDVEGRVLKLCRQWKAGRLLVNMEYEVDELRRDAKIVKDGVGCWISARHRSGTRIISERLILPSSTRLYPPAPPGKALEGKEQAEYLASLYPAGEHAAQARLKKFIKDRVNDYHEDRNGLADNGTSMLSVHFASGTLSARQAVSAARDANALKVLNGGSKGIQSMNKPLKLRYSTIPWPETPLSESHFRAFCIGHTGYPVIDAAIRQLLKTKYMHNRARIIVASFLIKDLLIDWRRAERFFMEHLVDGDFASNNGDWGRCAGTGVNPQPYFRIFNPLRQSLKFDPRGEYIRTWVEELRDATQEGRALHAPFEVLGEEEVKKIRYVAPLVEHNVARKRCLEVYKGVQMTAEKAGMYNNNNNKQEEGGAGGASSGK
ncbi:hypothetical protein L873DRAFT_1841439 [Choiromyces venosus 120613-1]|uniref:Photolyase/cryptochrome alpha/beta domain-containing protein n=1 Tax=Choiromyces venosus 120613-1 TaxID=1336337 RepID=A0A3N4JXW2_9PEZI|nr:hypothetical protein L873DRAFT_1841439 [Choiromyces venosus 120613-1]